MHDVRERIVDLRGAKQIRRQIPRVVKEAGQKIFITDAVMVENSATEIRRALRADDRSELTRLVPPSVADYIRKYELYRESNEA